MTERPTHLPVSCQQGSSTPSCKASAPFPPSPSPYPSISLSVFHVMSPFSLHITQIHSLNYPSTLRMPTPWQYTLLDNPDNIHFHTILSWHSFITSSAPPCDSACTYQVFHSTALTLDFCPSSIAHVLLSFIKVDTSTLTCRPICLHTYISSCRFLCSASFPCCFTFSSAHLLNCHPYSACNLHTISISCPIMQTLHSIPVFL